MKPRILIFLLAMAVLLAFAVFGRTVFRKSAPASVGVPLTVAPVPSAGLSVRNQSNAQLPTPLDSPAQSSP
ncbi:MAG: hypothetical protein H7301_06500 [Cryobacterium sp.]|nr:hypothetical protein [Oligoflexia bacterium]